MITRAVTLAVVMMVSVGCPDGASICDTDRYGCSQDTDEFTPVTDGCPKEPLTVTIGHGLTEFNTFESQADVPVEFGAQGGTHAYLALQASGVAINVTKRLKTFLRVWYEVEPGCMRENQDEEDASCRTLNASRNVLLGGERALNVVGGAPPEGEDALVQISEYGLIIFTAPTDSGSIEVTIEDECGRVAKDIHWVGNAGPQ